MYNVSSVMFIIVKAESVERSHTKILMQQKHTKIHTLLVSILATSCSEKS